MNLTEHFTVKEMECPCCTRCEMQHNFMLQCEEFRYELQEPLRVTSGYRCAKHNASLKDSSPYSKHLEGLAADIIWTSNKYKMISTAMKMFDGIGIGKTYIHVDKGGIKKVWIY